MSKAALLFFIALFMVVAVAPASANTLTLRVYDETDNSQIYNAYTFADIWEIDGSSSQTVAVDSATEYIDISGYENIMVRVYTTDDSYYSRTYFIGSPTGDISLDAYLPPSSADVVSTIIHVTIPSSWVQENVNISINGMVSGSIVTVASGKLDVNNEFGCYLLLGKQYTVTIEYEGTTYSYSYIPYAAGVFYINIITGISPTTYMTSHSVRYWYTQEISGNRSMTFHYEDSEGLTDNITAVFYTNGTEETYSTTVNASSAVITFNVTANNTTPILLRWESYRDGATLSGSHWFTHEDVSGLNVFDSDLRMGIALGFIILTTLIATAVNGGIGVLVAFSTVVLFSWLGWLPINNLLMWLMGIVVLFAAAAHRRMG